MLAQCWFNVGPSYHGQNNDILIFIRFILLVYLGNSVIFIHLEMGIAAAIHTLR